LIVSLVGTGVFVYSVMIMVREISVGFELEIHYMRHKPVR